MTSSNAQGTPIDGRDAQGASAPGQTPPNRPLTGGHAADGGHAGLFAAALRIVSGLTLASRFAGLARDVITARLFGDTGLGSAFRAAYAIPNLFRRLFGEGALSAAFIPQYTTLDRTDPKAAGALASLVISALLGVTGVITVLIEVALVLRLMLAPADESLTMSIALVALMIPMMPMVCLAAIIGGMLQVHGKFGVPAAGPIILNAFQIAMAAVFLALGVTADMDETAKAFTIMGRVVTPTHAAYGVAIAALLASVAQVAWSWNALRGRVQWKRSFQDARSHGVVVLKKFVPVMLGLGTLQLNTMLDTVIAMWPEWVGPTMFGSPVPLDKSSNAVLSYTQTLYQFPLGVFGIAVATAAFPLLARTAHDPSAFASTLRRAVRLSLFIAAPATMGLLLVRHDLVATIFGGPGGFSQDGLDRSAAVLSGFSLGVWAYSVNHVITRAFYARGDTRTPMTVAIAMVMLNLTLNLTLIWSLKEAGLAYATATSATVQCLILTALSAVKLKIKPLDRPTLLGCARILACAAIMTGAVLALYAAWNAIGPRLWGDAPDAGKAWIWTAVRLGSAVVVGGGSYAIAAIALRAPELRWLFERHRGGGAGASMSLDG